MTSQTWLDHMNEGDTLVVIVDVLQSNGQPRPLTGATVEGAAALGDTKVAAESATVTDVENGEVTLVFAAGDLTVGIWNIQTRVTIGSELQTVQEDRIQVRPSNF